MATSLDSCSWPRYAHHAMPQPRNTAKLPRPKKPVHNLNSSRLGQLPREVRDHIYSYLLPDRESKVSISGHNTLRLEQSIQKLGRIDGSGQLHTEALQTYWRTRTFIFCRRLDFCFSWRSMVKKMISYGIDVHKELRQVEICAWSRLDSTLVQRTKQKWELTRDALKMSIRILGHCTSLNTVNICFDADHLWVDEVRPMLDIICGRLSIEVSAGGQIERWAGKESRAILEGILDIETNEADGKIDLVQRSDSGSLEEAED